MRRAKSAATRTSSDKRKQQEDHPMFHVAWDENTDENSIINWIYDKDGNQLRTEDDDDGQITAEDVKRKMERLHLNRYYF